MCASPVSEKRKYSEDLVSLEKPLKRSRGLTMDLDVIHKHLNYAHCEGCKRELSANLFPYELSQVSGGAENSAFIFDAKYLDDVFIAKINNLSDSRYRKIILNEIDLYEYLGANEFTAEYVAHYPVTVSQYALILKKYPLTLSDLINAHENGFNFRRLKIITKRLISILEFLKSKKNIHADFKGNNFFIDDAGKIVLGDFGVSSKEERFGVFPCVQSIFIKAPEVVLKYDRPGYQIDMWSLGCLLYKLSTGKTLFDVKEFLYIDLISNMRKCLGKIPTELIARSENYESFFIKNADGYKQIYYSEEVIDVDYIKDNIIAAARARGDSLEDVDKLVDLIKTCLRYNPHERLTIEQAKLHPFVI